MSAAASDRSSFLRDPMTVRRLRLACGLVLFAFVALHLAMHALGNWSFAAMQEATRLHDAVWHTLPGTVLLYGAFTIHFALALYALYARRSFRMGGGELARLALGFSIVPLLARHYSAVPYASFAFDVTRHYDSVLPAMFVSDPWYGGLQVVALVVVWTHGCLGIHFWLHHRPGYARAAPGLLALAILWPTLSLLGVAHGTRDLLATAAPSSGYGAGSDYSAGSGSDYDYGGAQDDIAERTRDMRARIYWGYALLVGGVFAARGARSLRERRRGMVSITYPGGRQVRVPVGYPVLEASRAAGIPHASICGGRGRCTTCRIRVLRGFESLPPPRDSERSALARLHAGEHVRLACQLRPTLDLAVLPLLPPDVTANDPRRNRDTATSERFVAIVFIDIRRSTALFEKRMPYDVVFLLNHFFDAVAGAIAEAGGAPNQFLGDGVMAIFGIHGTPRDACAQALAAARLVALRLGEMNRALADELATPIVVGMGVHAGTAILGEIGHGDRFLLTAIGDTVHVAARLQDLTKQYTCELVVSQEVADTAGADLSRYPAHAIHVRGREEAVLIRVVPTLASLAEAVPGHAL